MHSYQTIPRYIVKRKFQKTLILVFEVGVASGVGSEQFAPLVWVQVWVYVVFKYI